MRSPTVLGSCGGFFVMYTICFESSKNYTILNVGFIFKGFFQEYLVIVIKGDSRKRIKDVNQYANTK